MTTEPVTLIQDNTAGLGNSFTATPAYGQVFLYTHRDITDGKKRGEVVSRGNFPPQTVAGKARYGMFPWQVGSECLARDFRMSKLVDGKVIHGETVKGCPDCRTAPVVKQEVPLWGDRASLLKQIDDLTKQIEALLVIKTQPVQAEMKNQCPSCPYGSNTPQGLKIHVALRHKKKANNE